MRLRFLFLLLCLATAAPAAERPNIVLILADDLGVNDLACYGRAEHRTPQLDRLATQGMRFTTAYTAQPICSPSRAALMTGKHPARLHLTNYLPGRADAPSQKLLQPRLEGRLPLAEVTIAELLREAGYATGQFGKWHLGGAGYGPQEQGFDTALITTATSSPSATEGSKHETATTVAAERFMEEHRARPFFCYVAHHNPHIPLNARPEKVAAHATAFHPTYAAMVETLDEAVGRLIQKVEALGLTERTLFIFTSDNGGLHVLESPGTPATHNTPFRAGKGFLYEGGLREPLIVRWPGQVPAGAVQETPVSLLDLMPTLLEAAGIDPLKTTGPLDGTSMLKLWRGAAVPARPMFWHFPNYTNQGSRPASALREGEWKIIEHLEDGKRELFQLTTDPGETRDLAATETDRVTAMAAKLSKWREQIGAQMPQPNPAFDAAKHRALYVDKDPSTLRPAATALAMAADWRAWREAMNAAVVGGRAPITPAEGIILLSAASATVHAEKMRYEPQTYKNTLGYWVNKDDWAEWTFDIAKAGKFEVEVQQGCGKGSAGAEVEFAVGGHTLLHTVVETGHFQNFIRRTLGEVSLPAGPATLTVKPRTKPGAAVMDLREVRLIPIAP